MSPVVSLVYFFITELNIDCVGVYAQRKISDSSCKKFISVNSLDPNWLYEWYSFHPYPNWLYEWYSFRPFCLFILKSPQYCINLVWCLGGGGRKIRSSYSRLHSEFKSSLDYMILSSLLPSSWGISVCACESRHPRRAGESGPLEFQVRGHVAAGELNLGAPAEQCALNYGFVPPAIGSFLFLLIF